MRTNDPSFIRLTVLTGIVASLALMSAKVLLYRPLLAIPRGAMCSERQACWSCMDFLSYG
jgi:hypothetical protein